MKILDKKDKKILSILDMDARQPISRIAKKVGLSKEVTNYRIKRMEKEGIIKEYYAVIDIYKLGYIYCRYHLWLHKIEPKRQKEIIKYLNSLSSVSWVTSTEGEGDLVIIIREQSIQKIKNVCNEILCYFSTYIKEKQSYIIARIHHFKHNYLYGTADRHTEVLGKSDKKISLDGNSIKILNVLSTNARAQSAEIAAKIGISAQSVRKKINDLLQKKVILCFRAQLNVNKLGYQHFKVFLELKDLTKGSHDHIIEFLIGEPTVIYITESLGKADLEFEIIVKNNTELYSFMNKMRDRFKKYLSDYYFQFLYEEHTISYLPA